MLMANYYSLKLSLFGSSSWKISQCLCLCLVIQSCPALCDPWDCGPPVSSVHGIFQARILEWGRPCLLQGNLLDPGIKPQSPRSPALQTWFFILWAIGEAVPGWQLLTRSRSPSTVELCFAAKRSAVSPVDIYFFFFLPFLQKYLVG